MTPSSTITIFVFLLPPFPTQGPRFGLFFGPGSPLGFGFDLLFVLGCRIHLCGLFPPSIPHVGSQFWFGYQLALGSTCVVFSLFFFPHRFPIPACFFINTIWLDTTYCKYFLKEIIVVAVYVSVHA